MKNIVFIIKLNSNSQLLEKALLHAKESYENKEERFYYTTKNDTDIIRDFLKAKDSYDDPDITSRIVFIDYINTCPLYVKKLYIGTLLRFEQSEVGYQLFYQISDIVDSVLVINNFLRFANLDIQNDFGENAHITIEDSSALIKQLSYSTNIPCNIAYSELDYKSLENEISLSHLAQKNHYCKRLYNALPESNSRGEFQRDYDRIVHSKAFRRMSDKAQIFTSSKGDHYRTRMTHTLCVAQIARGIAIRLNMNVPLTEAIALGHDLGHTPFGHQGERTLNEIVKPFGIQGFKHNYQSLKVATKLEEEYIEHSGLDLSVQALEGMWKHTKIRKKQSEPLICNIDDFIPNDISSEIQNMLYSDVDYCSTIEGQIVFIADEIAQRSHDLEDALSAGLLSIDNLLDMLSFKKLNELKQRIEIIITSINEAENNNRSFVSKQEMLYSRISSNVIKYFIDDVVKKFNDFVTTSSAELLEVNNYFEKHKCVDRQLISFTDEGKCLNGYLETIVTKQVINSAEVATFDDKASRITAKLFDLYYNNPRLLHDGTLQRVYIEMRRMTENVIHFQDGDISLVNKEWELIKNPSNAPSEEDKKHFLINHNLYKYDDVKKSIEALNKKERKILFEYVAKRQTEYNEKRKILVLSICDFIAGMTDTYAIDEYRKLIC